MEEDFYVTVILERHYIGKNTFVFSPLRATTGSYDEKTGIFTDDIDEEEYCSMLDTCQLTSEIPYAYNKIVTQKELKECYGDIDVYEAIYDYGKYISNFAYFVNVVDGKPAYFIVDFSNQGIDYENAKPIENKKLTQKEEFDLLVEDVKNDRYTASQLKILRDSINNDREKYDEITKMIDEKLSEQEVVSSNNIIDINKIYNEITKVLIAQDAPTRRLLVELTRKLSDTDDELKKNRPGILITGATGVGKTKLLSLVAEQLDLPFMIIDSTQLTMPGYVGKNIEEYLWDLYVNCDRDIEKTEHAIIYFDEIDKKGSDSKSDVAGQGVLNTLLKFLDGTTYNATSDIQHPYLANSVNIDTSKMIVLAGGAFADLYEKFNNRKETVGFKTKEESKNNTPSIEDFYSVGMPREFMGRFPTIIHLNDLSKEDLKDVYTKSLESPLKKEQTHFQKVGVKLTATDSYIDAIANKAYELKYGARGLAGLTLESTWMAYDDVVINKGKYKEVIVSKETLDNPANYKTVEKEKVLVKK